MATTVNENIYRVIIKNEYKIDIVTLLYQPGMFDAFWQLREKYGLSKNEYPKLKGSGFLLREFMSTGKHVYLEEDIEKLRMHDYIPPHFSKAIYDIITLGIVGELSYKRTYYEYQFDYGLHSDESGPGKHVIVLHPATTKAEVLAEYNHFLKENGVKTKSAMKAGKSRTSGASSAKPDPGSYYHRILSFIDDKPLNYDIDLPYEAYREVMLDKSYIPFTLKEIKEHYSKYVDFTIEDYKRMRKTARKNTLMSDERNEANTFINIFEKQLESVKDRVKKMKRIIRKDISSRFLNKAIAENEYRTI